MLKSTFILSGVMSVFLGGSIYAMENENMVLIKNAKEVVKFADMVVAYTAATDYFDVKNGKYVLSCSNLNYGHISYEPCQWKGREKAYYLSQLSKKYEFMTDLVLADRYIAKGDLYMRSVTPQEAEKIIRALKCGEAQFSDTYSQEQVMLISKLEATRRKK